jgi:hypothetical protein
MLKQIVDVDVDVDPVGCCERRVNAPVEVAVVSDADHRVAPTVRD